MTALQIQFRDELWHWIGGVLGIKCEHVHIGIFAHAEELEYCFGVGSRLTVARMPFSQIGVRFSYQRHFAISVLNGMLQEGIYNEG